MRKLLMLSVASVALLTAASAYADVTVTATIDKTKDITVNENVTISTNVSAQTFISVTADKFAESDAVVNQSNHGNRACENCAEKSDLIGSSDSSVGANDSVSGNAGYVSVNQAAGNMNNQGNAVSVAIDSGSFGGGPPPPPPTTSGEAVSGVGFAEANASVQQINGGFNSTNTEGPTTIVGDPNFVDTINVLFRTATIANAINDNTGVVQVNQSPGQMNNQSNVLSLAFSERSGGVALAESDLGQFNQGNFSLESDGQQIVEDVTVGDGIGIHKSASILGSINNNIGIVGVNQSAGNMANQANVVSFSAVLVPIGP
jgi:hypothetical protein